MEDNTAVSEAPLSQPETGLSQFEYAPEAPISDGGFAFVYRATDRASEAEVALKVLKPEYEGQQAVIDSFFRDPLISRELTQRNIVKILDVGESTVKPYFFTMEYCAFGDLRKVIQKSRRLALPRGLRHAMGICDALQYCHESGVFHRDIKASNILIRDARTPVLSDFGNALRGAGSGETGQENVGSPPYMSPEAWQRADYTAVSDLYSFGVLLYYMITGVLPFSGQAPEEFRKMHLFTAPSAPSKWRSGVTKPLDEVVLALLEKNPRDRIASAAEVRSLLERIYQESYEGVEADANPNIRIFPGGDERPPVSPPSFPFTLGKANADEDEQNHLTVGVGDPYVSRCHAMIEQLEDGFYFIDVSTNGSWVNGTRVHKQSIELWRENRILMGKETALTIKISGTKESPEGPMTPLPNKFVMGLKRPILTILGAGVAVLALWYLLNLVN